jgi:cytochrome bd-type quinol oxidase subunit 2
MDLDVVLLSRIQFAFTISFHIIFPSFTIALAAWLALLEGRWLQAASPPSSLRFLFYGAGLFVIPVILIYTITVYWVFRGKIGEARHYG